MLPTSLPGGIFGGMTAARPTSPRAARPASVGMEATSSGVRPPSGVEGLVGAAVRDADHVLHGAISQVAARPPPSAAPLPGHRRRAPGPGRTVPIGGPTCPGNISRPPGTPAPCARDGSSPMVLRHEADNTQELSPMHSPRTRTRTARAGARGPGAGPRRLGPQRLRRRRATTRPPTPARDAAERRGRPRGRQRRAVGRGVRCVRRPSAPAWSATRPWRPRRRRPRGRAVPADLAAPARDWPTALPATPMAWARPRSRGRLGRGRRRRLRRLRGRRPPRRHRRGLRLRGPARRGRRRPGRPPLHERHEPPASRTSWCSCAATTASTESVEELLALPEEQIGEKLTMAGVVFADAAGTSSVLLTDLEAGGYIADLHDPGRRRRGRATRTPRTGWSPRSRRRERRTDAVERNPHDVRRRTRPATDPLPGTPRRRPGPGPPSPRRAWARAGILAGGGRPGGLPGVRRPDGRPRGRPWPTTPSTCR